MSEEFAVRGAIKDFQGSDGKFERGKHWRNRKPFWDREWLVEEYINKQRSAGDIAKDFGLGATAIQFWLKKHGIVTRTTSETRAVKHWGLEGEANPMFGKKGPLHPNWKGGITPERQEFYASKEWGKAKREVRKRDKLTCQLCKVHKSRLSCQLEIHHIEPFEVVEKRADVDNLVLLCEECHDFVHSKQNFGGLFLVGGVK